jgi:hypothetical protein
MKHNMHTHLMFRLVAVIILAPITLIIQFWIEDISRVTILAIASVTILFIVYAAFAGKNN